MGAALREHVPNCKEQFCIATLPSHASWGVGVQNEGITRYHASRTALAVQMLNQLLDLGFDPDFLAFPMLEALVNSLRGKRASRSAPKKRRKEAHSENVYLVSVSS